MNNNPTKFRITYIPSMNEFKTEEQGLTSLLIKIYFILSKFIFNVDIQDFDFLCVKLPEITDIPLNRPKVPPIDAI